jgi:hypothetical protein
MSIQLLKKNFDGLEALSEVQLDPFEDEEKEVPEYLDAHFVLDWVTSLY